MSACGSGRIVELEPEIQLVIEQGQCSKLVKRKAKDVLELLTKAASGK